MSEPKLYVGETNDYPLVAAPAEVTNALLSFLSGGTRRMEGGSVAMHRNLLPYWREFKARGIRLQRIVDHRIEAEWNPPTILRTRRYRIWLPEGFDGGELLVTTRWQGGRLGIVRVEVPMSVWE